MNKNMTILFLILLCCVFSISLFKKKKLDTTPCEESHNNCTYSCMKNLLCLERCDLKYKDFSQEEQYVNCTFDICKEEYDQCTTDKGYDNEECFTNAEKCIDDCKNKFHVDFIWKEKC